MYFWTKEIFMDKTVWKMIFVLVSCLGHTLYCGLGDCTPKILGGGSPKKESFVKKTPTGFLVK